MLSMDTGPALYFQVTFKNTGWVASWAVKVRNYFKMGLCNEYPCLEKQKSSALFFRSEVQFHFLVLRPLKIKRNYRLIMSLV